MKLLCINIHPDFTWFTSRGLKLDVTFLNVLTPKFPIIQVPCNRGDIYVPDVSGWALNYSGYDITMIGWKPQDYGSEMNNTGGYTYPEKLSNGTRCMSVRVDSIPNNMYPLHEMMHTICNKINIDFGDHIPKDFMDMTPVGNPPIWKSYYKNNPDLPDLDSNFNQTWRNIIPFLDRLNDTKSIVTLTRKLSTPKETIGELRTNDGKFGCNTLELPWKNNQKNISCIPTGTFDVKRVWSFKFGWVYEVQNVPNRTAIYFHEGNYFFNTLGCILVGSLPKDINKDGDLDIQNSKLIRRAFENYMNKQSFVLVIK